MEENKKHSGINGFLNFLFWMLVFGIAVRLFEAAMLGHYQEQFWPHLGSCLLGVCYDVLFFSKIALVLCPIYLLIHHFSPKAAKWTFRIIGTIMLLVSNAMIMYFVTTYTPLDKIFFQYSVEELIYISKSTGAFVWWGYVGLLLIPLLFLLFSHKEIAFGKAWRWVWLALAALGFFVNEPPAWAYRSREGRSIVGNKQEFFWKSLLERDKKFSRFNAKDLEQQHDRILDFQSNFPEDDFVDFRYPLAHLDHSPDVLSSYFDLDPEKKPNLVFIITEGLSREFSGYNSKFPSATPFLDSLADHSLNWVNCMSSSQRTIAVLPSMFGSLPFGKRGFMQSSNTPRFHSLPNILKDNGYTTSFFYGGWTCFDDMCYFLNDMGVDNYLPNYTEFPKEMQNTWGLYDGYLFSEALKRVGEGQPRLDIYLTLSTHDPFDYPDKARYTKAYADKLIRNHQQNNIEQWQYEQYASYLYYDDCLRQFFADYAKVPGFENTIFVITGDHCFNGLSKELDKYHVPLVVWSPMLKEAHRFPAMVAHRDITPSFLAMIKHQYPIQTPEVVSWLNTGLDTSATFRANTFTPQLKNSRKMDNMVFRNRFYDEGIVYQFGYEDERLTITPVDDEEMKHFFEEYRAMDDYVMENDALLMLDEDKQQLMLSVDSTQSANYTMIHCNLHPVDTLEHEGVFKLRSIYPFNLFEVPLTDTFQKVVVYADFGIYIPEREESRKVCLAFALEHADGTRTAFKTMMINYDWYEYYDRWQHYSMTQAFSRSQLGFVNGDKLICYFTNGGQREFYISDFQLKVVGVND